RRSVAPLLASLGLAAGLALGPLACGDPATDSDTDSGTGNITTSPGTNPTTGASSTGGSGGTASGTGGTGGEDGEERCQRYIECISVTAPAELPAAQEGFGAGSLCWTQGPQEAQVCADACEVGLEQLHKAHPEEPKCYECTSDGQCDQAAGELCFVNRCQPTPCGDGIVDPGEVCDGTSWCEEDCRGGAVCSPLTGAPCEEGTLCTFSPFLFP